jgi:hypothetical protein
MPALTLSLSSVGFDCTHTSRSPNVFTNEACRMGCSTSSTHSAVVALAAAYRTLSFVTAYLVKAGTLAGLSKVKSHSL